MITLCINLGNSNDLSDSFITRLDSYLMKNKNNINYSIIYIKNPGENYHLLFQYLKSKFNDIVIISEFLKDKNEKHMLLFNNKINIEKHDENIDSYVFFISKQNINTIKKTIFFLISLKVKIRLVFKDYLNKYEFNILIDILREILNNGLERYIINFLEIEKWFLNKEYSDLNIYLDKILELNLNFRMCMYSDINSFLYNSYYSQINEYFYKDNNKMNYCNLCYLNCAYKNKYCILNKKLVDFFISEYNFKFELSEVIIYLTEKCNMKCKYCFEGDYNKKHGNIGTNQLKKIMDLLFNSKNKSIKKNIVLYGGEPSLNKEGIKYILEYLKKEKNKFGNSEVSVSITSNLLNLSNDLIEILKGFLEICTLHISVSMDGAEEIHDKNRIALDGSKTYRIILNNMIKLRMYLNNIKNEKNIKNVFSINQLTIITHKNINYLNEIIDNYFINEDNMDNLKLYLPVVNNMNLDIFLDDSDYQYIFKIEEEMYEKYPNKVKKLDSIFSIIGTKNKGIDQTFYNSICSTNKNSLAIRSNGDITFCYAFYRERLKEPSSYIFNIDCIKENIEFKMKSKIYLDLKMPDLIENNVVTMKSELGFNCKECSAKYICRQCQSYINFMNGISIIKPKEICLQTLSFWNKFLDKRETEIDDKLKKLVDDFKENNDFLERGMRLLYEKFKNDSKSI